MSIIPMLVKCDKCGKKFSYNTDVGNMFCPRCHAIYKPSGLGEVYTEPQKDRKL